MPSEKRARQRAAREAKLAAEAKRHRQRRLLRNGAIVVVVAAVVVGTGYLIFGRSSAPAASNSTTTTSSTAPATTSTVAKSQDAALQAAANKAAVAAGCPASTSTRVNDLSWKSAPALTIDPNKTYTATVTTTAGTFTIALDSKTTPQTVNNFVFLADNDFYKCVIFHRVIPGFMDQTGDPTGTGEGGPGYTIPDEYPAKTTPQYPIGSVAMANTGQPHTGGSQWFVVTGPEGESLPPTYSLFGHVTSGQDVVDTINAQGSTQGVPPDVTQRILSVKISES